MMMMMISYSDAHGYRMRKKKKKKKEEERLGGVKSRLVLGPVLGKGGKLAVNVAASFLSLIIEWSLISCCIDTVLLNDLS
jgi:hypothetical protein